MGGRTWEVVFGGTGGRGAAGGFWAGLAAEIPGSGSACATAAGGVGSQASGGPGDVGSACGALVLAAALSGRGTRGGAVGDSNCARNVGSVGVDTSGLPS